MVQYYHLLFRASVACLRLVLLFPKESPTKCLAVYVFVLLIFNVFHIKLLFYHYWPSQVEKLSIIIVYCFYPFSVFWLTKVVSILFTNYSVIVKCFVPSSFIEYIILLLKLFVNFL